MVVVQKGYELDWPSTWEEAEDFAHHLVDGIGYPIDEGILEAVVALNMIGLHTCQSCEGHLDDGLPYPWIDFETNEFPAFQQALEDADDHEEQGAQLVALAESLTAQGRGDLYERLEKLLCAYYEQNPMIPEEWRMIILWGSPIFFRLMPLCGFDADEWPENTRAENLARAQAEMQAFTIFLKNLWQQKQDERKARNTQKQCVCTIRKT